MSVEDPMPLETPPTDLHPNSADDRHTNPPADQSLRIAPWPSDERRHVDRLEREVERLTVELRAERERHAQVVATYECILDDRSGSRSRSVPADATAPADRRGFRNRIRTRLRRWRSTSP